MKAIRLKQAHIRSEWDEGHPRNGGDGYWISLKSGWRSAADPCEPLHTIHEDTKTKARNQFVLPCECSDCKNTTP